MNNTDAITPREHPFATDELNKGSVVDAATVAEGYGVKVDTVRFRLALLQAGEYIERRLAERGLLVVVAQRKNDLIVLTDAEAALYTAREFRAGLRKAGRNHAKGRTVDRANLPESARNNHDRELELQGRTLSAIRTARRTPVAIPTKRATPLPPGAKE